MHFLVLAIVLAIGVGYIVPWASKILTSAAPSLTQSPFVQLLITGVILAATIWAAKEVFGKEIKA